MKKQLDIFLTALMFLTRIRVPKRIDHNEVLLQKSVRYFSWVGIIVGAISSLFLYAAQFAFSPALSILFSMVAGIIITGAFHEDGFADVCDAFGGGWTKQKILVIMKDSRLGTYGVIGLISILSFKFLLLLEFYSSSEDLKTTILLIITAHATSRLVSITLIQQYRYVTETDGKSKSIAGKKLGIAELLVVFIGGMLPFIFLNYQYLIALIPLALLRIFIGNYFYKWIGGYTGDCLGALQQVSEITFYICGLLIWKYI